MGSIAGFTAQQTSDFTFGLTEPLLSGKLNLAMTDLTMSILDGPLEQTCSLEDENLDFSQINPLGYLGRIRTDVNGRFGAD